MKNYFRKKTTKKTRHFSFNADRKSEQKKSDNVKYKTMPNKNKQTKKRYIFYTPKSFTVKSRAQKIDVIGENIKKFPNIVDDFD